MTQAGAAPLQAHAFPHIWVRLYRVKFAGGGISERLNPNGVLARGRISSAGSITAMYFGP